MTSYRHRSTVSGKQAAAILAAAALGAGLIQGAHQPTSGKTAAASTMAITTPSGGWTPAGWARALLRDAHLPRTVCDRGAIEAWIGAEGSNPAWRNLLDTTMPEPGSQPVNSVGVQSYRSWREGLDATVATLRNGDYPAILSALGNGGSAQAVADAVARSPWGTQSFQASCGGAP
jgi:hypothetical protein